MLHMKRKPHRFTLLVGSLIILAMLLAACGGSGTTSSNNAASLSAPPPAQQSTASSSSGGQQKNGTASYGPKYLIKSSKVSMSVKDTRKVAADLQAWITTTDPRSTSAGIDYEQIDDNQYNVTMTFSVQATMYNQVRDYLRDYAPQHDGKLVNYVETIQDVTNDYVDTQSRLKNLRTEQQRLLTLLSSAQSLSDTITIEQRLTDVEGQIEQIEAHLSDLNSQVTFYNITVSLQPIQAVTPPPANDSWNVSKTFQDALSAAKGLGEVLVTLIIWLATFSVYILPVALIVWFILRRRRVQQGIPAPVTPPAPPQTTP